jgi:DNA invertase Pin-like site-specific DNA recombinase
VLAVRFVNNSALAEFERDIIRKRTNAGLEKAVAPAFWTTRRRRSRGRSLAVPARQIRNVERIWSSPGRRSYNGVG